MHRKQVNGANGNNLLREELTMHFEVRFPLIHKDFFLHF